MPSAEELLALVRRSPERVAAQDREGWLGLFADDGAVEDPVGAAPNPRAALGRFYDTFIAGNTIAFEVHEDLVAGTEVVREVTIHTRLSTGLEIEVPAHLLYEVVDRGGGLRIRRLRAIWDLRRRSAAALGAGPRGLWTLAVISLRMLRRQGLGATLGYSRGLVRGIFGRGPATVGRLVAAIAAGDREGAAALFTADATVEWPVATPAIAASAWFEAIAGADVVASAVIAAGWLTSWRFEVTGGSVAATGGIAILEFDPATRRIARARFFVRS